MAIASISKLGNFVWEDKNGDGIQNAGEVGLSGVTVKLYGQDGDGNWSQWGSSVTTDAQGFYSLRDFSDGDTVRVQFVLPAGYAFTQNTGAITATDNSDVVDAVNGYTANLKVQNTDNPNVTIIPGETEEIQHNYVDAGVFKYATLASRVWNDSNANGIQDAGEPGLDGVTVRLLNADGTPTGKSVVSANGGQYSFGNVVPGNYKIEFVALTGYTYSPADQGGDETKDSDALADGKTAQFAITSGESINNISAGLFRYATIGNLVWSDNNQDGIQNSGEKGLAGVTVELRKFSDNSLVSSTTSDANGAYQFLAKPGDYKVKFSLPTNSAFSAPKAGTDVSKDSDANISTGYSDKVTVTAGQTNNDIDAGIYKLNTITGNAWADDNADGQRAASEAAVSNVVVKLMQGNTVIAQTTTDANGAYSFGQIKSGSYSIQFAQPSNYLFTHQDKGNDATDSDVDKTGRSAEMVLSVGTSMVVDAGLYRRDLGLAELGDKVWLDANKNGIQNNAEVGVPNIAVKLFDIVGHELQTATTNASGLYGFTEVVPGDYKVQFIASSAYDFSPQYAGTNRDADSNANVTTGWSDPIKLVANEKNMSIDAGLLTSPVGSIQARFWHDQNANGSQDSNESTNITNGTVKLYAANDRTKVVATATVKNAEYAFDNVEPGEYVLKFERPASGEFSAANASFTKYNAEADLGSLNTVIQMAKANNALSLVNTINLDYIRDKYLAYIDSYYQSKTSLTGISAPSYLSQASDAVNALIAQTSLTTQPTMQSKQQQGHWMSLSDAKFTALQSKITQYGAQLDKLYTAAISDSLDSDVAKTDGWSDTFTVKANDKITHVDAGLVKGATVGDRVWLDYDGDGIQEFGEQGFSNATVTLYKSNGDRATDIHGVQLASQTTNSGAYQFTNVMPGEHYIQVNTNSAGYKFTAQHTANPSIDSDVNATGKSGNFMLQSGETNNSIDAGVVERLASIGDYVWHDVIQAGQTSVNGIQDANETGLNGVLVELYMQNSKGKYVATGKTDITHNDTNGKAGAYLFDDLTPGNYQVVFSKLGYALTWQNQGGDRTKDSDADRKTGAALVSIYGKEQRTDIDAGMSVAASVTGVTFYDGGTSAKKSTTDGLNDSVAGRAWMDWMDNRMSNVSVGLWSDTQGFISRTTSRYTFAFNNLPAGNYKIQHETANTSADVINTMAVKDAYNNAYDTKDSDANRLGQVRNHNYKDGITNTTDYFTLAEGTTKDDIGLGVRTSPIVLDLNHDGIKTVALSDSQHGFDLLGVGQKVNSGWLSGQDGFLAVDTNGNAKIDSLGELFGGNVGDGFAKLADFDSNHDGIVNANDTRFAELKVWQDVNGNKVTDEGELFTLADAGIVSLNVNYVAIPALDANDNLHLERSSATLADGSVVDMTDVYFSLDQAGAEVAAAAGVALPTVADLLSQSGSLDSLLGASASQQVATVAPEFDDSRQLVLAQQAKLLPIEF